MMHHPMKRGPSTTIYNRFYRWARCRLLTVPRQALAGLRHEETLGKGYGLHWEELDVDLSLPGLMAGIFGTRTWMARRAGQATSAAKAAAARANGAKGGRPRKAAGG